MSSELNLRFPDEAHVLATFDGEDSERIDFKNPLTPRDRRDLPWYLEVYGAHSLGDPDDAEAARIAKRLPELGQELFDAVFQGSALRLFQRFQDHRNDTRLLTVSAEHPEILALPWELLHDSSRGGAYLFRETPRISIRRRLAGATGGRPPFRVKPKDRLHLLFVVSRPQGAGFLDPRADPKAVLDALEEHAPGRVTWEFLRPPTLDALVERLEDRDKPAVDVLHFDGHGVFDRGTGYLLFENASGGIDFVTAQRLGENLHRCQVALVVLSACESAMLGDQEEGDDRDPTERAMGSVAVRLTSAGLPTVLAMTHTVLVATTRALFGELYRELARGRGLGEALDHARQHLAEHPEKYEVQRGPNQTWLKLQDWFVPTLYQSGEDLPLLRLFDSRDADTLSPTPATARTNLPSQPQAGFYGRRRELWKIETWFAAPTRRITITGFGGQGKTILAQEAGRWLVRTGMFQTAAFVDYSCIQAADALAVAVSQLGSVLGISLPDAEAARQALVATPTLVILDNLEALAEEPLLELLDAAVGWSTAGEARVLLTTRRPDFEHPEYRIEGTRVHRRIQLSGLGSRTAPDDALEWFGELMKLPPVPTVPVPRREELIDLFAKVKFHPLSIRVLAEQAKIRSPAELGERLEGLLAQPLGKGTSEETLPELVASLQLSLDRLDPAARAWLPCLGVFHSGAWELMILQVSGAEWAGLHQQLEAAALVEAENLPGETLPYFRFHPALAPMLWTQLNSEEQARLECAHRKHYYGLAKHLYHQDYLSPRESRAMAFRELPNLLHAVHAALGEGDPNAVDFADSLTRFLSIFGLQREIAALAVRSQAASGEPGSRPWYLEQSNRGEQLLAAGRAQEATAVFCEVLVNMREIPNYERALTLKRLGDSLTAEGRPDLAECKCREALAMLDQLAPSKEMKGLRANVLVTLAIALTQKGHYAEAREVFQMGLELDHELGDLRGQGVSLGLLGDLSMYEGNLQEAIERYRSALTLFQELQEPASEAKSWHNLGMALQKAKKWDEAEHHYRASARLKEQLGDLAGAARTWDHLGIGNAQAGNPAAAEAWFRKGIEASRKVGDIVQVARALNNLAVLLLSQSDRVTEARELAEEALTIKKALNPNMAETWTTYLILGAVAAQEGQPEQAYHFQRLARESKRDCAGTRRELQRYAPLVFVVLASCTGEEEAREELSLHQAAMRQDGERWSRVANTLDRLLAGQRDADYLCEGLDLEGSMIVEAILEGIEDPLSVRDLLPAAEG